MYFNQKIKEDVLDILFRASVCLKEDDLIALEALSDRTVHNASVFQDQFSIEIAVVMYALSKILKKRPQLKAEYAHMITHAQQLLAHDQIHSYTSVIKEIIARIKKDDEDLNMHVTQVIEQAQIKRGSRLYYHGISLAQSASVLGVSQWELYNYVGKTTINDDGSDPVQNLKKRLEYARGLFDSKTKGKILIFDAGPIITMAMNHILYILPQLKKMFHGDFLIPHAVHDELITKPLTTHQHKLEAFQVIPYISDGTLHVVEKELLYLKTQELLELFNTAYYAFGNPIKILHEGEVQAIALLKILGGNTLVVDERTTRYLIETPSRLLDRLETKLHTKVTVNKIVLDKVKQELAGIRTIRSAELLVLAYEQGLFNKDIAAANQIEHANEQFFEALLWGIKLSGCAVSDREVEELIKMKT